MGVCFTISRCGKSECSNCEFAWANFFFFFLHHGYLSQTLTVHRAAREGGNHLLFHSNTSTHSRKLRHLFATLHVRWISRIFNCNACVYQTATQWDLPPYQVATIWLIDWLCNAFFLDQLILSFCYNSLNGEFELALTITLVVQANRLTKCASHPN